MVRVTKNNFKSTELLNENTIRLIDEARERIKSGRYLSEKEAKHKLKIQ